MKGSPRNIDEARLRPHLRIQEVRLVPPDSGMTHIQTFNGNPTPKRGQVFYPSPEDLRGIPVTGRGVGGAIRNTRPDHLAA